jgi:DNA-binding beta-propeller fold protein YncE
MNKTVLFATTLVAATGFASTAAAQPKLVKKWETEATLKVPESVYFDKAGKVLYVANIDGEPWGKDGAGSIGKVGLDGKVIAAEWVKGLNAPKGMALSKGTLWVADLAEVVGIDVAKGTIATRVPVEGASRLNDLTMDAKGALYVSDSQTKKVHKIEGTTVTTLLEGLKGPNGLLAHGSDLYVLDSGGLYQVQADKQLKMLADGMEGGTDGVEPIKGGGFVVSTWGGVIYHVGADGTKHVLQDTRADKTNSADIGFDPDTNTVYVPTFFKNTVAAYTLQR